MNDMNSLDKLFITPIQFDRSNRSADFGKISRSNRSADFFEISKLDKLGAGAYGTVYKSKDLTSAIKSMKLSDIEIYIKEITNIIHLNGHENIVDVSGVFFDDSKKTINIVMPLAMGTLNTTNVQDILERKNIMYQILKGLAHIHGHNIIHRDIKPDNILVYRSDKSIIYKIADFGSSIFDPNNMEKNVEIQTILYRAPEVMIGDRYYTNKIDLWSIGMIFYQMINYYMCRKNFPLNIAENKGDLYRIIKFVGYPTEENWRNFPTLLNATYMKDFDELYKRTKPKKDLEIFENGLTDALEKDLLFKLLSYPDVRISAIKALKHSYFDEIRQDD